MEAVLASWTKWTKFQWHRVRSQPKADFDTMSAVEKLFYFVTNTTPDDPLCWNRPVFAWAMDQRHSQFNCRTTHLIYIFHHLLRKFGHKRCNGIFHA